ncbi:Coproporphyrinogen III oxidase [Zopfochytrium polystomum]|nr:Coproporphyrinogen III oxidase [Zopfochytrium polystomum]
MRVRMEALVRSLQAEIVDALQAVEDSEPAAGGGDGAPARSPAKFRRDAWERPDGDGAGLSCILQDGRVFEKAAVLVSVVRGAPASEALLRQMRARALKGDAQLDPAKPYRLFVAGISLVVHPHNPNAPTAHLNYRYFELREDGKDEPAAWWFGGGSDLTPSYIFEEDAAHFHSVIKAACDKHDRSYYPRFKTWCDTYFHLPHRDEHRGVGGIFFDDLDERPAPELARFVEDCGRAFVAQYVPVVARRKDAPFSPAMKTWQQIRRGRYAEFNLVYDRGTKFGLATPGARVESIMCSLPLTARWEYAHEPEEGSDEWKMVQVLKNPREWA